MKKKQSPLYNPDLERALKRRAQEDLERKAMEKARNEYNYEQYMKKRERAEAKARFKFRRRQYIKPGIYLIVMILIILYAYLQNQGISLSDLISDIIFTISNRGA